MIRIRSAQSARRGSSLPMVMVLATAGVFAVVSLYRAWSSSVMFEARVEHDGDLVYAAAGMVHVVRSSFSNGEVVPAMKQHDSTGANQPFRVNPDDSGLPIWSTYKLQPGPGTDEHTITTLAWHEYGGQRRQVEVSVVFNDAEPQWSNIWVNGNYLVGGGDFSYLPVLVTGNLQGSGTFVHTHRVLIGGSLVGRTGSAAGDLKAGTDVPKVKFDYARFHRGIGANGNIAHTEFIPTDPRFQGSTTTTTTGGSMTGNPHTGSATGDPHQPGATGNPHIGTTTTDTTKIQPTIIRLRFDANHPDSVFVSTGTSLKNLGIPKHDVTQSSSTTHPGINGQGHAWGNPHLTTTSTTVTEAPGEIEIALGPAGTEGRVIQLPKFGTVLVEGTYTAATTVVVPDGNILISGDLLPSANRDVPEIGLVSGFGSSGDGVGNVGVRHTSHTDEPGLTNGRDIKQTAIHARIVASGTVGSSVTGSPEPLSRLVFVGSITAMQTGGGTSDDFCGVAWQREFHQPARPEVQPPGFGAGGPIIQWTEPKIKPGSWTTSSPTNGNSGGTP